MSAIRLEAMVDYLAGREGEAAAMIRAELADPTSEASRFLESTRSRSKALIASRPAVVEAPARPPRPREGVRRVAMTSALAASVLAAAGVALWLGQARLDRLELALARRESGARAEAQRLEAALSRAIEGPQKPAVAATPPDPRPHPIEQALARVEVGLGRLDRRIEGLDRPAPEPPPAAPAPEPAPVGPDPAIVEIRRDVAALRRELQSSNQAGARQVAEIRMALQEVGNLLRLAIGRDAANFQGPNLNNGPIDPTTAQLLTLMGNLGNAEAQTRLESVQQLGRMGQDARRALPMLQTLLGQETDQRVRAATQSAIGAIGSQ